MKALFDKFYGNEEATNEEKKGLVRKKIVRAFDSAIDGITDDLLENEENLGDARRSLAQGNTDALETIAQLKLEREDLEAVKKVLEAEKAEFFGTDKN